MTFLPMKTPKAFAHKLAHLQSRAWLPSALLLLALASVFIFGGDRGHFYRESHHDARSARSMAIAENLSVKHNFLLFPAQTLGADGEPAYELYNRVPIGGYALIKLATLPFGDSLSAQIYAARMLMLLFFAAAAALAYLSLRRLTASPWIALTAALLAFSSAYCLYYADLISGEAMIDLFALLLVFHGMVIFEQEGRFLQLLAKTCIALLLGWHAYALLLPFIVFGLERELFKALDSSSPNPIRVLGSLIRNRYMALGAAALLFGISVLTFNLTNEYLALNRETPLTDLPSIQAITSRAPDADTYSAEEIARYLPWPAFLERQFHYIGAMALPYFFSPSSVERTTEAPSRLFVLLGIPVLGASLIGLLFVRRHKILLVSLTLSGFFWMLPMRHNTAFPDQGFEAIFHIGVAITLLSLVLLGLRRLSGERFIAALSAVALLAFVASGLRMSQLTNVTQTSVNHKETSADLESIRDMAAEGKVIWARSIPSHAVSPAIYYLSGRIVIPAETALSAHSPDFIVASEYLAEIALTPRNRLLFLYAWDDYHTHITEIIEASEPVIRSDFDVYIHDKTLMYVKDACHASDTVAPFFLAPFPVDENDLPDKARQHGFENHDFGFEENSIRQSGERCVAIVPLPHYDIARIHTGQYTQRADGSTVHLWEGEFHPTARLINDMLRHIDELIEQAGDPLIRSDFDVYLNADRLIYVKGICRISDTDAPFFLALYPVDENDLSAGSRQRGFHNLDFNFQENGSRQSGERCVAIVPLPDYTIARIHTGQYIQRADGSFEHTWEGEARLTEAAP